MWIRTTGHTAISAAHSTAPAELLCQVKNRSETSGFLRFRLPLGKAWMRRETDGTFFAIYLCLPCAKGGGAKHRRDCCRVKRTTPQSPTAQDVFPPGKLRETLCVSYSSPLAQGSRTPRRITFSTYFYFTSSAYHRGWCVLPRGLLPPSRHPRRPPWRRPGVRRHDRR